MKRCLFVITFILASGAAMACERAESLAEVLRPSQILGVWYFGMGAHGNLKLDLKSDQTFEVSAISKDGEEEKKPGGTWTVNGQAFVLSWPDGESKVEEVVSVNACELRARVGGGGTEVYHRKPVQ